MPGTFNSDDDSQMDGAALAAQVAGELFPQDSPGGEAADTSSRVATDLGESAPAIADPAPGLTAAQIKALPKSWKKEMEPHWAKLPGEVHDYVYTREADVMRGLQQYQQGHQQWDALIKPYASILQQHPNVNPIELMQGLMNAHLRILGAPQEARRQHAAEMLKAYGIDIESGQQQTDPNSQAAAYEKQLSSLREELSQLKTGFSQQQQAAYNAELKKNISVVEEFASKPENKYYPEVETDILRFLKTGAASSLAEAYELACYANPAVRAKVQADQLAAATAGTAKPAKNSLPNINGTPNPKPRQQRVGTMEDTINSVILKHYPTH